MSKIVISIVEKVGNQTLSLSRELEVPDSEDCSRYFSLNYDMLNSFIADKKKTIVTTVAMTTTNLDARTPVCPICGAAMKPRKNGKGWNCSMSKWRTVNGQWLNSGCDGTLG